MTSPICSALPGASVRTPDLTSLSPCWTGSSTTATATVSSCAGSPEDLLRSW
jgi:hypothetical protein